MCLQYIGGGIGHQEQADTNATAANQNVESAPDEDAEHNDEYGTETAIGVQPEIGSINPELDDDDHTIEADAENSDVDSEHDSDELDGEHESSGDEDDFGLEDDLWDKEDNGFDAL